MNRYPLIPALALAALASLPLAARADLMKQGSTYNRDILVTDTTGANVNSLASGAFTVTQSQAGGAATTITPTITFKASGHYNVAYTAAMTATLGSSALVITATGATQTDVGDQIVAFDPNGANLGLTNLDAAVSTRSTFAGGAVASVTAPVTLPTTAPTGYGAGAGGGTAQTGDLFALLNPLVSAGKFTAPALSLAPAGTGGGTVTVAGYAAGQDPATLLASSFAAVPASTASVLLLKPIKAGLTLGQLLVTLAAADTKAANITNSWNASTHVLTTVYQFPGDTNPTLTTTATYPSAQVNSPALLSVAGAIGTVSQP